MPVGRAIVGVVAGVATAGAAIFAAEAAGHAALAGEAVFGAVAVGYGLGAMCGTLVAGRIAGPGVTIAVPLLLAALTVANLWSFPHPWWFVPAAAMLLVAGWRVGVSLSRRGSRLSPVPRRRVPGTGSPPRA